MKRAAALLAVAACAGCTKSGLVDFTMSSAPHHARSQVTIGPYQLLAGDMHCHVLPPDAPYHVHRELPETVKLASDEGLDFVVLTPHVPRRFFLDPEMRAWVRRTQADLRAKVAAIATDVVLIPGMEYTDHELGHLGMSFADVGAVLDAVPLASAQARPELFFETWESMGGLTTINHPFLYGTPRVPIAELHYDLSWRGVQTDDVTPEIRWLTTHADAVETWNESVGHLRDRYLFADPEWTMRQSAHLADRLARSQERRVAPVGGSDSHGSWLRPTMWVLATEKSAAGVRDAIARGRTCVRAPEACTLQVQGASIGASVASAGGSVRAHVDAAATYFVNGVPVATAAAGETTVIPVTGECSLVRAQAGDSISAPIYVDCAWAH